MAAVQTGQYFLKDKKAQIYNYYKDGTTDGGEYWKPVSLYPLWCYTKQLTQQPFGTVATLDDESRLFVFNYRNDVYQYDYIHYRHQWFEITRVDTKDDYRGELFVYVKNLKYPPVSNSIKSYSYDPDAE